MSFTRLVRALSVFGIAAALAVSSHAEQFPSRPIKILVGFGAAGSTDAIARLYGQKMSGVLGTPVIVENKPGALQAIAIRALQFRALGRLRKLMRDEPA